MSIDPERQKSADRILKLLALAGGTAFAAEAATARAMAEQLMTRHNIDLGEGSKGRTRISGERYVPFAKGAKWEYIIVDALTDLCNCKFFFDDAETLARYCLVGTIADLEVLRYMLAEIHRQRIAAWLQYKRTGPDSFHRFCYAFAQALASKISDIVDAGRDALDAHQKKLKHWYEIEVLHGPVQGEHVELGRASSAAGLQAGRAASLNRGAVIQTVRRITYDR